MFAVDVKQQLNNNNWMLVSVCLFVHKHRDKVDTTFNHQQFHLMMLIWCDSLLIQNCVPGGMVNIHASPCTHVNTDSNIVQNKTFFFVFFKI